MADRESYLYQAKLAEQAERYDGIIFCVLLLDVGYSREIASAMINNKPSLEQRDSAMINNKPSSYIELPCTQKWFNL